MSETDPQRRGITVALDAMTVTAAIVDTPGAHPRLGSVTLPSRTPGTTLIEVVAAPLNPLDLLIASGAFHSARHEAAYVPGTECVGVVIDSDTLRGRHPGLRRVPSLAARAPAPSPPP